MAPFKQEEYMKNKLEKRSLTPSPESWATLANRLDAEQQSKNKSKYWWFGIAASIVGLGFVAAMYFSNPNIENNTPVIVNTKENLIQEKDNSLKENLIQSEEVVVEKINSENNIPNKSESSVKTVISEKNQLTNKLPQEEVIAQSENSHSPETSVQVDLIEKSTLSFEDQKVQDVVAQINNLKSNGSSVTDLEIENLLNKAQKEILSNRIYNNNTRTVDANALLQDVEDDLQKSFRSKVLEALQSGYESVRTAVAERNN